MSLKRASLKDDTTAKSNGNNSYASQNSVVSSSATNLNSNIEDVEQQNQQEMLNSVNGNTQPQKIEILMPKRNLGPNGAYLTSQKLKVNFNVQKVDLSENSFQDEGIIYLALAFRLCLSLTHLNLSSNLMTHYGFRILLENLNRSNMKFLDVSGNPIGSLGMEYMVKYLEQTDSLEYLNLSSINLEEDGAKKIGVAISMNSTIKKVDLSWNHIRKSGAVMLAKGLAVHANNSVQEINLSYNGFGIEGISALSECIKYNKTLKVIDLSCNRLKFDAAIHIANALKVNKTLHFLDLSNNQLTTTGVYQLLTAINDANSSLKYLGLKNVPILKQVFMIIELIQQKRRFSSDIGPVVIYSDNINGNQLSKEVDDDPMMKLSRFLTEKRLRLIDMLRILDKKQTFKMDKDEFIKRLKIFEPRLKNRDIFLIADNLSTGNVIEYDNLYRQVNFSKNDAIAHENSIIRLRLQTLKKNRIYMKNIEQQFSHLLQERDLNSNNKNINNIPVPSNKKTLFTLNTIDDWLKETNEDDVNDYKKFYKRQPKKLLPLQNRTTLLRSANFLQEFQQQQEQQQLQYKRDFNFKLKRINSISDQQLNIHQKLNPISKSVDSFKTYSNKFQQQQHLNGNEMSNDMNSEKTNDTNETDTTGIGQQKNMRRKFNEKQSINYNPNKMYKNVKSKIGSQRTKVEKLVDNNSGNNEQPEKNETNGGPSE